MEKNNDAMTFEEFKAYIECWLVQVIGVIRKDTNKILFPDVFYDTNGMGNIGALIECATIELNELAKNSFKYDDACK